MANQITEVFTKLRSIKHIGLISLLLSIFLGAYIRLSNFSLIWNKGFSGLDPWVFYRYAQYIVDHGRLFAVDMMRYVPDGLPMNYTHQFYSYFLAYTYKFFFQFFGISLQNYISLSPVIYFLLSLVFLYLFVAKMFNWKAGAIAVLFISVIPGYVFRTTLGFADHESLAMLFAFISLASFAYMLKSEKKIFYTLVSSFSLVCMGLTWGGSTLLTVTFSLFWLLAFLEKSNIKNGIIWCISFLIFNLARLNLHNYLYNFEYIIVEVALIYLIVWYLWKNRTYAYLTCFFIGGIALATGIVDAKFLLAKLIEPAGQARLSQTVSENQTSFLFGGSSLYSSLYFVFWPMFIASIYTMYKVFKKKLAAVITFVFVTIFSLGMISPFPQHIKYIVWFGPLFVPSIIFLLTSLFIMFMYYKIKKEDKIIFSSRYLFIAIFFFFSLVISRGAIRTMFMLIPSVVIMVAVFLADILENVPSHKQTVSIIMAIAILFMVFTTAIGSANMNTYTGTVGQQWQDAYSFIREETPTDSVILHWWDYGYWTQALGERATVLDGGNAKGWDHAGSRYGLISENPLETFEYYHTHNVTHLLFSSEEIPKYHAFSFIGSDENLDKESTIGLFKKQSIREVRNGTTMIYGGQWRMDQDIVVGNYVLQKGTPVVSASFTYNNESYSDPKIYAYVMNEVHEYNVTCICHDGQCYDYNENASLDICLMVIPGYTSSKKTENEGVLILSNKVHNNLFTYLYLQDKKLNYFNKVYDDGLDLAIYDGNLRGPIRIWEVDTSWLQDNYNDSRYLEASVYG